MPIVQNVDLHDFRQAFKSHGREDNFSHAGLEILFDYLENLSEEIGEDIELDVIALCCEYTEHNYKSFARDEDIDLSEAEGDESEEMDIVLEYLQENTSVCGWDEDQGIIVYADF